MEQHEKRDAGELLEQGTAAKTPSEPDPDRAGEPEDRPRAGLAGEILSDPDTAR